jgi:uncharacterized membrane protein YdbT with pleckstrin-like domain
MASERVIWRGRTSHITNLGTYILCLLFFWLVIPIFVAIWKYIEVRGLQYELTNERFKESSGVLNLRFDELELYRVKDTALMQPIFLRLFGLASIELHTEDTTTPLVIIEAIPADDAKRLHRVIRETVEAVKISRGKIFMT